MLDQFSGDPQSWNLYGYVRNNPLRFVDPTGNKCVTLDDGTQGDDGEPGDACPEESGINTTHRTTVYAFPQINPLVGLALRRAAVRAKRDIGIFAATSIAAGTAVGGGLAATAGGVGLTTVGTAVRGTATLGPLQFDLTNKAVGAIVRWGTGQAGAAITRQQAQNLTRASVKEMQRKGLTRRAVQDLLKKYEASLAEGGLRAANTQLVPRINLMKKILELW